MQMFILNTPDTTAGFLCRMLAHQKLFVSPQIENLIVGLHFMYVISILTLVLTITGIIGACKEKKWALIVVSKET